MKTNNNLILPIYDTSGKKTQRVFKLSKEIFDQKINSKLIAQYIRVFLFNKRSWNASTKTRAEVNASKRKIYRQKGTGRARHGAISAPIFVGGGVAFGPKPKKKKLKINQQQKRKAFFGSLTDAAKNKKIIVVSDTILKIQPKTKKMVFFLNKIKIFKKKVLLLHPKENSKNLISASRNIKELKLILPHDLNTYDVINSDIILFVENGLQLFQNHFIKK